MEQPYFLIALLISFGAGIWFKSIWDACGRRLNEFIHEGREYEKNYYNKQGVTDKPERPVTAKKRGMYMTNQFEKAYNTILANAERVGNGAVEDPIIRQHVKELIISVNGTISELYDLEQKMCSTQDELTAKLAALDKYHEHFGANLQMVRELNICDLTEFLDAPTFKYDNAEDAKANAPTLTPSELVNQYRFPVIVRRRLMQQQQAAELAEKEDFDTKSDGDAT